MKAIPNVGLKEVTAFYNGQEGDLFELLMGEQIHIGGFKSSMELAARAGIGSGMHGDTGRFAAYVDLYINMADMQLTYDAMKIIGFNMDVMQAIAGEFRVPPRTGPCRQSRTGKVHRPAQLVLLTLAWLQRAQLPQMTW